MGVAGLEAIRQEVCIGSGCPYGGAPIPVLQKVSAPNAWVPLWLCPNGCAPKSQCPKCLGAPMAVPKLQCPYGCAPNAVPLVPASIKKPIFDELNLFCSLLAWFYMFSFAEPCPLMPQHYQP